MVEVPASTERVEAHTAPEVASRLEVELEARLRHYALHPEGIDERLRELDREWDVERILQANAATLTLAGTALGAFVDRRFLVLPAVVGGFLLQHAVQGWCPPLPLLRRAGRRTPYEIDVERFALKALRGDFARVASPDPRTRAAQALRAVGA